MNAFLKGFTGLCVVCWMNVAPAQETNALEQLKQQLRDLQERFERVQREQRDQIQNLQRQIDIVAGAATNAPPPPTNAPVNGEDEKQRLEQELAAELSTRPGGSLEPGKQGATAVGQPWSPAAPLTLLRSGSSYMNISFDAMLNAGWSTATQPAEYLQLGDHDPSERGFSMRNAEIALDGAVDPYFKGFANVALKLESDNSTGIELEEAYLQTSALPAGLQLKAGQFFANFGRHNPQHPHQWAFVDQPVILNRSFGPDGLRNVGAQLSWLPPTPFYTEATLSVLNGRGGTAFSFRNAGDDGMHGRGTLDRNLRGPGDLLYVPRLTASWDLTDQQTLLAGASAALGPNDTGPRANTRIVGTDLYWKWRPANAHAGFPFLSVQTEFLYRQFDAGQNFSAALPAERLDDYGFYAQALWGFRPRWVAGLRGEYANGDTGAYDAQDIFRGERERISPALTFYPSEFSKIRLQYNYDRGELFGTEHSVWLQLEFLLGAHGAHRF